jgi:hypothetical protein
LNQEDFTELLESELVRRGVTLTPEQLSTYVEAMWPVARQETRAERWAERFVQTGLGSRG